MNPNNPPAFPGVGYEGAHFAYAWPPAASMPCPAEIRLWDANTVFHDQLPTKRCSALAGRHGAELFLKLRGVTVALSDYFIYWQEQLMQAQSPGDNGLNDPKFLPLAMNRYGVCLENLGPAGLYEQPSDAALADAATRRLDDFNVCSDTADIPGAVAVATLSQCPVVCRIKKDSEFDQMGGPIEDMPGKFTPGAIVWGDYHYVCVVGLRVNEWVEVSSNLGGSPVIRMSWEKFFSNLFACYAVRGVGGFPSTIDAKLVALPFMDPTTGITWGADVMVKLRYYLHNLLRLDYPTGGPPMSNYHKAQFTLSQLQIQEWTRNMLYAAFQPWADAIGVNSQQFVDSFLDQGP